ncbi:MAG: hypothetical protein ABIQ32_13960 [Sphingomicrobium sp.]
MATSSKAEPSPHPHYVSIPDSSAEGVRAYREPAEPCPLQLTFLTEAGERAWVDEIRALLSAGQADEADKRISAELAGFEGALARLCKAATVAEVALDGWEDLPPILDEWEGPSITAITLGLTNPPDLVFEAGRTHAPELLIGLYSDEAFPFSRASKADLIAECDKELPAWVGGEEDIEFHCELTGVADVNTALINCKHRYFLRDGRDGVEGRAPGGYVEFVLANWLLATRFLQAANRVASGKDLPAGCRLIVGTVEIDADFLAVLGPDRTSTLKAAPAAAAPTQPAFATLVAKPWVPHEDPTVDAAEGAPTLRQRLRTPEATPVEPQPRAGLLARLFGRFRRA